MKFFSYQTLLAACHFCSDINQSALAAVLPFLVAAYHYDYATAAMLVLSSNIIGSLIQPLLGTLSDKHNWPWIMPLGLFMAGGGIALTGVTSDFYLLCLFTMISGIGVAMFHPQGALMVNRVSTDENRGISLSVFSFGGNMGFTFGAAIISASIAFFGLPGTLIFFIPEIIICLLLLALTSTSVPEIWLSSGASFLLLFTFFFFLFRGKPLFLPKLSMEANGLRAILFQQ